MPIVYLTVCTAKRQPILANVEAVSAVVAAWRCADHWKVGRWVLMPDHLHLFCSPATDPGEPLAGWVNFWKSLVSREWRRLPHMPLWHRGFWDTQLRRSANYDAKLEYVKMNSVRKGLVAEPEQWPFQGEENVLRP